MKILLLVRALGFGGTERQVVQLALGLARRGHRVSVAAFYPGGAFGDSFSGTNPEYIVIGKRGRWDVPGFLWRLTRAIARRQPDVIHGFLPLPNLLAAFCRTLLCRRAALVWGLRGTPLDLARYDWLERASIRLEGVGHRLPDLVIANSASGAAWALLRRFAADRVTMIANGIDAEAFRPATPQQRAAARAALGCPPGALLVAVVARLDPMKDHATFLTALAIAARSAPRLSALIAGDGPAPTAAGLRAGAAGLGVADRLIWMKAQRRVGDIYHAADLLCLPSAFGEGFPNVVGEAMACGLSCIVTSVGDAADLVGPTGRVVPPRNPAELARAMLDLVKPIRENCPPNLAARRRIIENFGLEAMISATENALLQVVAHRAQIQAGNASK